MMFVAAAVFALVITVVFVIRQFSFEYALVISIGAGVVTNILGFLVADLKYSSTVRIGLLILMSIVCGLIAYAAEFFKRVLDYTAIERVQFEDDDYYYYVKAVPKINLSMPRHNVRRMVDNEGEEDDDYEEHADISIVGNDDVRYEEYTEDDYNVDTDTSDIELEDDSRRFPGFSMKKETPAPEPVPSFAKSSDKKTAYEKFDGFDFDDEDATYTDYGEDELEEADSKFDNLTDDDKDVKYVDYEDDDFT